MDLIILTTLEPSQYDLAQPYLFNSTIMKKLNYTYAILISVLTITSCDSYLEDDIVSPNDPEIVTPQLLLSNVEVATFATYGGQLTRQSLVFSRQLSGTSAGSQSAEIARYIVTEITNENEWEIIWAGAVVDCKTLISEYGPVSPYYSGIAKVILAMNYGVATDLWGAIPAEEGGLGLAVNLQPQYESQEVVLGKIQTILDEAIVELSAPVEDNFIVPPGADDLIFGGDVTAWLQTAQIMKARYANRLSIIDPVGSANNVLAAVTSSDVTGSESDAFMIFFGGNAANQWFQFEQQRRQYYRVSSYFADLLIVNNDPRLPFFLKTDGAGGYSGTPFDNPSVLATSYVGPLYGTSTSSVPLVTFVEAKFLEAEAQLRLGASGLAADAHNAAVIASIQQATGGVDSLGQAFIDNFGSENAGSITQEKIMMQKYIAMFIQIEVYADQRRTNIPALNPNPSANTGIPVRLPTPQSERLYNPNAIVVSDTQTPVYWDVN